MPFSGAQTLFFIYQTDHRSWPMLRKALSVENPGTSGSSGLCWDILVHGTSSGQTAGVAGTQLLALLLEESYSSYCTYMCSHVPCIC